MSDDKKTEQSVIAENEKTKVFLLQKEENRIPASSQQHEPSAPEDTDTSTSKEGTDELNQETSDMISAAASNVANEPVDKAASEDSEAPADQDDKPVDELSTAPKEEAGDAALSAEETDDAGAATETSTAHEAATDEVNEVSDSSKSEGEASEAGANREPQASIAASVGAADSDHDKAANEDVPTSSKAEEAADSPTSTEVTPAVAKEESAPLTIEEKRKQQRESKMTIEEKRKLQQSQPMPSSAKFSLRAYWDQTDRLDRTFLVILLLCEVMNIYISLQVLRYVRMIYAGGVFVTITLVILLILWIMNKKKYVGYVSSGILALLMMAGCFGAHRLSVFSSQIFNNVETDTVMIVAKKESELTSRSDFTGRKLAMVEYDQDLNEFAREILRDEKKKGYQEITYTSYKEAYMDMQEGKIDMMIYNAQIQKRLEEDEIDSAGHIKVLFEKHFKRQAVKSKAVDITKDSFNVLISGVDLTSYGINEKGSSDVNIILTVNPQTKKMIMQTIPRDSWVPITCMNDRHSKLTYAGAYGGIDCSIQTIEKEYGITINYYAKINFQGVIDLVDALDGITVISDVSFCESHPFEGYGVRDYCYAAGENYVSGIEALMFSRIRRVFSDGDIERGRHQMALIEGVMNKFMQEPTIEHINGLLGAVENNFTTNLNENDIVKALELFLKMQDQIHAISTYTMEGELIWQDDEISQEHLYYFFPHDGEVAAFQQRIRDVMEGK